MPARKYSDDLLDEAARMRERGLSCGQISRKLKMSVGSVYWHCLRLGADSPKTIKNIERSNAPDDYLRSGNHVRRFTDAEDVLLREMDMSGTRVCVMSRRLGRKPNSVRGRLMALARHDARREAL